MSTVRAVVYYRRDCLVARTAVTLDLLRRCPVIRIGLPPPLREPCDFWARLMMGERVFGDESAASEACECEPVMTDMQARDRPLDRAPRALTCATRKPLRHLKQPSVH